MEKSWEREYTIDESLQISRVLDACERFDKLGYMYIEIGNFRIYKINGFYFKLIYTRDTIFIYDSSAERKVRYGWPLLYYDDCGSECIKSLSIKQAIGCENLLEFIVESLDFDK